MSSSVLGIRGLASESEVIQFFGEIAVKAVVLGRKGGTGHDRSFNGEAFVELDPADAATALEKLHLSSFGSRNVEVFPASLEELARTKAGAKSEVRSSDSSSGPPAAPPQAWHVIKLRGLPYATTPEKVLEFLGPDIDVQNGAEGVVILSDEEGRPLGEALVELASEQAQQQAMQTRHKATLGGRYVELYTSSKPAFDQAKRSSGRTAGSPRRPPERTGRGRQAMPLIPPTPPPRGGGLPALGPGGLPDTQATLKLRGLPYSAGVDDITEWLAGFKLADDGVKIVTQLDSSGRPLNSGLAYVRFESAAEAQRAAAIQHRKTMGNRYIECLPVSPTQRMPPRLPMSVGLPPYSVGSEYGMLPRGPERVLGPNMRPPYTQDSRRPQGSGPGAYVSAQPYAYTPQQQQHYYMQQQHYMMQQGMRPYAGAWVPQQVGAAGGGTMVGPATYAGGAHWYQPPPPGPTGAPPGYAVQGGTIHPGYASGYAMSMYSGMRPYPTTMPPAAAYPPSPILKPSLAPTAGFSGPSSSNSSRQTSLSEPLPRPSRERRSSQTGSVSTKEPQLEREAPAASDAAVGQPS